MAVYKVPQDVEAEDKFVGPLTFKQFLFFGGAAISGYLIFISYTKQWWPVLAVVAPFFLGFAALAFPWSKDQPTELWLAARIRFIFVPRKRIWDQSGIKDLVEITVPKRPVHVYSDGLSQDQVRNRLNALATVVDTRGWAVKNLAPNNQFEEESDRLVAVPLKLDEINERNQIVNNTMDVLDESSSQVAGQFEGLIKQSTKKHHEEILQNMRMASTTQIPASYSHSSNETTETAVQNIPTQPPVGMPTTQSFLDPIPKESVATADESRLLEQIHKNKQADAFAESNQFGHMSTIQPTPRPGDTMTSQNLPISEMTSTAPVDPAILALAHNDDLSVLTLAHQADKNKPDEDREVVVSLH